MLSLLFLLGLACPSTGQNGDFLNFRSPWEDLPKWSKDWSPNDWQTAYDRATQQRIYNYDRKQRTSSSQPTKSCASAWASEGAGEESASVASQRSGPENNYGYYSGSQSYPLGGSAFQNPNLAPFGRLQPTAGTWIPAGVNRYYSPRMSEPSQVYSQYASRQSGPSASTNQNPQSRSSNHPVETLPDVIENSSAPKAAAIQYGGFGSRSAMSPNMYRAGENPQAHPQLSVEDSIKTTNTYAGDYYRQIQQALAEGKQLVAGFPNQQLAPGTGEKLSVQPVFTTTSFPLTALTFDPEEMKRVYGQYYVPPVFSVVQKQPNGGAPEGVRDVLQFLLNQYQSPYGNGISSGFRNQRLLPDISTAHEKILHGFAPLQKLPKESTPQLPSFSGDNQLLPPNVYRADKWEPKTNLVVHDPVNLAEFEQSANQMGPYAARSAPCSRHKRQVDNIWGYYPELAPQSARMGEPMPMFPRSKSAMYGAQMGRTSSPGLSGIEDMFRQSMGGYGQPMGGYGQPMGGMGQPMGGMGQPFGNEDYPDYLPNYQGRDAASGIHRVISGFSQLMPMM